ARFQEHDRRARLHALAVLRVEHDAPARRNDTRAASEIRERRTLPTAESGFAFLLEYEIDVHARPFADLLVRVEERQPEHLRETAADGGLACAHGADEDEIHHKKRGDTVTP